MGRGPSSRRASGGDGRAVRWRTVAGAGACEGVNRLPAAGLLAGEQAGFPPTVLFVSFRDRNFVAYSAPGPEGYFGLFPLPGPRECQIGNKTLTWRHIDKILSFDAK